MDNVWVSVGTQFGGIGLLAYVMYAFLKGSMAREAQQTAETFKQMELRIEVTELRLETCEKDRADLHKQFAEMLLKLTHPQSIT